MKAHKIDHIGIVVKDLEAAKDFFLDLGFEIRAEFDMEGGWVDRIIGLKGTKTKNIMMGPPGGQTYIELSRYDSPTDQAGVQPSSSNTLGIRHIAIAVDDIKAIIAKLKESGTEPFSDIYNYEDTYKLCYIRGPEGIILELAEELK